MAETRRRVIDSLGCAFGAIDAQPVALVRQLAAEAAIADAAKGATVLGTTRIATPEWATFALGYAIRYLDFNDTYLSKEPAHPSDNLGACLTIGEMTGATGKDVLLAIVLAYEIQCRLADAFSIRAKGWDHVTYGNFSATLAAGKLLGASPEQLIHAQGLAGTPNNAMRQTRVGFLSNWKGAAFANAARNAVFAARLAKAGMTGPAPVFEGEMGFFAQVSHAPFAVAPLGGEPGNEDGFMMQKTSIKHFCVEYHAQSAVEAALTLREQLKVAYPATTIDAQWLAENVDSLQIDSFDAAVDIIGSFEEHWDPHSRETADHSMPYCVGAALSDGDITPASFEMSRIRDPQLLAFIQKISIHRHDEMNAGYPKGIPNRLRLTMKDGRQWSETVTYPLGHAHNAMTDGDVAEKFLRQAAPVLGEIDASALLERLQRFEHETDLRGLMGMLACREL